MCHPATETGAAAALTAREERLRARFDPDNPPRHIGTGRAGRDPSRSVQEVGLGQGSRDGATPSGRGDTAPASARCCPKHRFDAEDPLTPANNPGRRIRGRASTQGVHFFSFTSSFSLLERSELLSISSCVKKRRIALINGEH